MTCKGVLDATSFVPAKSKFEHVQSYACCSLGYLEVHG